MFYIRLAGLKHFHKTFEHASLAVICPRFLSAFTFLVATSLRRPLPSSPRHFTAHFLPPISTTPFTTTPTIQLELFRR